MRMEWHLLNLKGFRRLSANFKGPVLRMPAYRRVDLEEQHLVYDEPYDEEQDNETYDQKNDPGEGQPIAGLDLHPEGADGVLESGLQQQFIRIKPLILGIVGPRDAVVDFSERGESDPLFRRDRGFAHLPESFGG
jgi:hypothetical protein